MTEREEFEKFLSNKGFASNYCGDGQYAGGNQLAYEAWQACAELKDNRIKELEAKLEQIGKAESVGTVLEIAQMHDGEWTFIASGKVEVGTAIYTRPVVHEEGK